MRDKKVFEAKRSVNTKSSMFAGAAITSNELESKSVREKPGLVSTNNVGALSNSGKSQEIKELLIAPTKFQINVDYQKELLQNLEQLYLSVNARNKQAQIRKSTAADIVQSQLKYINQKR